MPDEARRQVANRVTSVFGAPTGVETCIAVSGAGQGAGHFRLTAASRVLRATLAQRRVAVLLAGQCAALGAHRTDGEVPRSPGLPEDHTRG